jgi:hypothetical protein
LGVITLKPDATSMLSLFWVLLVVAQPTVNAKRAMTLIMLNEFRICFMILGSFQVGLFLICHRRPFARTRAPGSPLYPSKLMPSDTHFCPRASCRTMGLWSYYMRERLEPQQPRICLAPKVRHSAPAWGNASGFVEPQNNVRAESAIHFCLGLRNHLLN